MAGDDTAGAAVVVFAFAAALGAAPVPEVTVPPAGVVFGAAADVPGAGGLLVVERFVAKGCVAAVLLAGAPFAASVFAASVLDATGVSALTGMVLAAGDVTGFDFGGASLVIDASPELTGAAVETAAGRGDELFPASLAFSLPDVSFESFPAAGLAAGLTSAFESLFAAG